MEKSHWELGTWGRIPVSMHWTVLLSFAWLYFFFWSLPATAIGAVALFALFVAHEFGHVAVLRRRKVAVESIELNGIHGRTSHAWASPRDETMAAWGGVGAQLLVLVAAWVASRAIDFSDKPIAAFIVAPMLFVLININIVLMIIALLPIGPFDGHAAWAVIPQARSAMRKRRKAARDAKLFPEEHLSPDKRAELEEASSKAAAELMGKLARKPDSRKEDA